MRFEGLAGNHAAKKQVGSYFGGDGGRLPHALLIEGPRGSGRCTLAGIIARAAVCRSADRDGVPCGVCAACSKALGGVHPDIITAGGNGTARSFHIDVVRALREDAYVMPNESPRKVFILADAQAMTEQAQNALLKLMEEPPKHLMLILTCESRSQMLDTIRSRAAHIALEPVSEAEALPVLRERFPDTEDEALSRALKLFGGVIGQAAEGLESGGVSGVMELAPQMAEAAAAPMETVLLRLTGRLEKDKELTGAVLRAMSLVYRDALVMRVNPAEAGVSIDPECARRIAAHLKPTRLMALIRETDKLSAMPERNINQTLFLTLICSRLRAAAGY